MAGSTRKITPQVPGESTAPESTDTDTDQSQPTTTEADAGDDSAPAAASDPKDDEIAALRAELSRCYSALTKAGIPLPSANPAAAEDALPHSSDIDHDTLTSPVLTKQGWLMPKGA